MTEAPKKISQTLLTLLVFVFFLAILFSLLKPVIAGLLFGVVLAPLKRFLFREKYKNDRIKAFVITLLFSVFFIAPITLIGIMLVGDLSEGASALKGWLQNPTNISNIFERVQRILPENLTRGDVIEKIANFFQESTGVILAFLASTLGSLPKFFLDVILLILTIFYTLADGSTLVVRAQSYLPFNKVTNDRLMDVAHKIVRGSFIGAILSAGAQAAIISLAFVILDIPRGGLFGALTFVTSFIPILGAMPGGIFGVVYLFTEGEQFKAIIMVGIFLLAGTVDNVIKPMVLKGSADLHPLIGLLSALGGLALMGFVGIFIGPMIAAICLESLSILEEESV